MPAPLHRVLAPIGRAVSPLILVSGLACGLLSGVSASAFAQNQGGMVPAEPAQAGAQYQAKPKHGGSAQGNAAAGDAAAHPASQPAPGPTPAPVPPPNPPAPTRAAAEPDKQAAAPAIDPAEAALVKRGEYIARASDCAPCHMSVGGTPFAGGLILNTPFGHMATPNITPDRETGIGDWTAEQFYRVIHDGIGPGHQYVYPTMTFTSYTKMTRPDVDALHAYLMSLPPVHAPRLDVSLSFPFNIRLSLLGWRLMFFRAGSYVPDAAKSARWNRGAYLVQGPGHCGECHSPRNVLGGVIDSGSLSGGVVDSFLAPNISSDPTWGIGDWSEDELVAFLKTGTTHKGVVFGPMVDVVHQSLAYLTDDDVHAIASYLKNTPPRVNVPAGVLRPKLAAASASRGEAIYATNCSQCHQANGAGVGGSIPNLAGNSAIRASDPTNAIMPVLAGLAGQGNYGAMPRFGGALSDADVADLANYIRTAWSNGAAPNATPAIVRGLRGTAPVGIGGSVAARNFGCPKIGDGTVPGALASEQQVKLLASADRSNLQNGITSVMAAVKKDNPDAASGDMVTTLNAAYCPVVANRADLSRSQKADALIAFSNQAGQQFARFSPADVSKVMASAPITQDAMAQIEQAAASAGLTPSAFIARTLSGPGKPATQK